MTDTSKKSILICEAGEVLLAALEFRLQKNGYNTKLAKDGEVAIAMIGESPPDLVVVDLEAEPLGALDLLKHLRHELKADIPLVMLADLELDARILEAFRLGVTDFVAKPFNPNELILRIRRIFKEDGNLK